MQTLRQSPAFQSSLQLGLEEAELARRVLAQRGIGNGVMVDVGAHRGTVTRLFASRGWQVHAFEPDPFNRMQFRRMFDQNPSVHLNSLAVGSKDGEVLKFYASEESTGISSLIPFHATHRLVAEVETTRLDSYLADAAVPSVDFLKIDTEGYDLFVLQGFPWTSMEPPSLIVCEFEDSKTLKVGYRTEDLVEFLASQGYRILISEWHPITRYGVVHSWRQLSSWTGPDQLQPGAWGNIIAVRTEADIRAAFHLLPELLEQHNDQPSREAVRYFAWRKVCNLRYQRDLATNEWNTAVCDLLGEPATR